MVRVFADYGRRDFPLFVAGLLTNVVGRSVALLPPLVLGVAIDAVFTANAPYRLPLVPTAWVPTAAIDRLWLSVGLIVGAALVGVVLTFVQGVSLSVFSNRVQHRLRVDAYRAMQGLDMTFFDDKRTGDVISILNDDVRNLRQFLNGTVGGAVQLVVSVVTIASILVYLNPALAVVTLVAVPALTVFTVWFMRTVRPLYRALRASVGNLNTRIEANLGGMEVIKTTGTERYETDRVESASREYYDRTLDVVRLEYLYQPGMNLIASVSFAATFVVGGYWLVVGPPPFTSGDLLVGEFVTFLFMTQRFVDPLAGAGRIVDSYENARASGERVFSLVDRHAAVTDSPEAICLADPEGRVTFEGVTFAYRSVDREAPEGDDDRGDGDADSRGGDDDTRTHPDDDGRDDRDPGSEQELESNPNVDHVLEDVSFDVAPGETLALVGPTGAGKSTVAKLLLRLYDVDAGVIRLDGRDVRELTAASIRAATGYVGQEVFLFDGTVRENLVYGRFDATDAEVEAATDAAEAHEFVTELPEGYDTRIGERGVKLSGGQRQRLAIARALLADPTVLVLDEATSAVDTETELYIQRALAGVTADRTTVVIAHRLSTVRDADTIVVLDGGRVAESGTHDELIARGGLYATLWAVQTGEAGSIPAESLERVS
jgi:ATP-binding cassette subfamily B protein